MTNKKGSRPRRSEFDAIFFYLTNANLLKKFQLLGCCQLCLLNLTPKILDFAKLFIRNAQNTRQSGWRHRSPNPRNMNIHILLRRAMSNIDRVLHHRKTILLQCFAELRCIFPLLFGCGWQIEKDKQPHNMIGI